MTSNIVWIAWEEHRRTKEICSFLGIEPVILTTRLNRPIKYPVLIFKTLRICFKKRPKVLIVQNPSIILTLVACVLKKIMGYRLVVDAHNEGLVPFRGILQKVPFLYRWFQRTADLTLVTNRELAQAVEKNKGRAFVLPDRIPEPYPYPGRPSLKGKRKILYICTFAPDEPYLEVIKSANFLPAEVVINFTGNFKKLPEHVHKCISENVHFLGYLSESDYWEAIKGADLVMDLTFMENCLVCGAYEAVAVGIPLVLSNTRVLKAFFHRGALFTSNCGSEIATTILKGLNNITKLRFEIRELRKELRSNWERLGKEFTHLLLDLGNK